MTEKFNSGRFTSERVKTHGMSRTKVYKLWHAMVSRATGKTSEKQRKNYFDRGITVCERWLKFENFFEDMGMPLEGHSLDRIDNDGPYQKENCRWADKKTQCNNTRRNVFYEHDGKKQTISQWAEEVGIKQNTLLYRLARGWPFERAIKNIKHKSVKTLEKEKRIVKGE